jgi:phage repressor protein C with HTH and peptisase S24 domain
MQEANSYSPAGGPSGYGRGMDAVRALIKQIVDDRNIKLSDLSRQLGKNHAYMQQFLERGIPAKLPEGIRHQLSELLDVDEVSLGAPAHIGRRLQHGESQGILYVPERDVRASAGPGAFIESETVVGRWPFPPEYIRNNLALGAAELSVITVRGDSMEPTLQSGDKVIVDHSDRNISQGGIFALHDGDGTVVKRIERIPGSEPPEIKLISDNQRHGSYVVKADLISIAGRVVWFGRKL